MPSKLILGVALFLALLTFGTTSASAAGRVRNIVMYYVPTARWVTSTAQPLTSERARALIAYIDRSGKARDWLFDGVLISSLGLYPYDPVLQVYRPLTRSDVAEFEDAIFRAGLLQLSASVMQLRSEFGHSSYTLKVYLWLPFTEMYGHRSAAPWVDEFATWFNNLHSYGLIPGLELAGFYWGHEEYAGACLHTPFSQCASEWMKKTADRIHRLAGGYEFIWIPSFHYGPGIEQWRSYGFDRVVLQPNYLQGQPPELPLPATGRFREVTALVAKWGLAGAEIELGPARNPLLARSHDPELTSARAYIKAAFQYQWYSHALTVFYHAEPIYDYATTTNTHREIYDSLYCLVRRSRGTAILPAVCPELAQGLQ